MSLETGFLQTLYDNLYQFTINELYPEENIPMTGGKLKVKPLMSSTKQQIKKLVDGKNRLVYVDNKRRQYIKQKGIFVPLRTRK